MYSKRAFLRVVSIIVSLSFLWSSSVLAGSIDRQYLAAQTNVRSVLRYAKAVSTGTAYHAGLLEKGISSVKDLLQKMPEIEGKAIELVRTRTDTERDYKYFKTLIFGDEKNGIVYYTFTPDGYFYRFTTKESVDDPFNRLIQKLTPNRSDSMPVSIGDNKYYQQIIEIQPQIVSLINTCLAELYPEGIFEPWAGRRRFIIGSQPKASVPDNLAVRTSSLTAAALTYLHFRGIAKGLDKKRYGALISTMKDTADSLAKRIYEIIIKQMDIILRVRVSEGFGRDEVEGSFKSSEVVNPDGENGIEDAIIDVVEGTNAFIFDVGGKRLDKLTDSESGATSIIVTGKGIESIGNCPDVYTDGVFTLVPKDKRQDFADNPLDPELTANNPDKIEEVLSRIAEANGIRINDLEVVLMDREREAERLAVLRRLQDKYSGLEVVTIKDGTVAHSLLATFGRREGKHKVVMTVGGAPEGFLNLAVASIFRDEGAIASVRIYSKNVNKALEGNRAAKNLDTRYVFSGGEKEEIRRLRPDDYEDIINGKKLFTQDYVKGDVEGSFSFITNNGVFGIEGAKELENWDYLVKVLRVGKVDGRPCLWFEDKIFKNAEILKMIDEVYKQIPSDILYLEIYKSILKELYSNMTKKSRVYTAKEAGEEIGITEERAAMLLDWLSSLDLETESDGQFKGIEKIVRGGKTIYQWLNPDSINPDIFRDYDFRSPEQGSTDFSPKRLFFMTIAWVSVALEEAGRLGVDNRNVVIARDCRKTSPSVIEAMIKAVEYSGLQAIYAGEKPNCAASYAWAVRSTPKPLMGIFLTASHVAAEDVMGAKVSIVGKSGELVSLTTKQIKVVTRQNLDVILRDPSRLGLIKEKPTPRMIYDVEDLYNTMAKTVALVAAGEYLEASVEMPTLYDLAVELEQTRDILETLRRYEDIVNLDAEPFKGLRVIIEAAHTPSGKLAAEVYRALGAEVILINEEILELTGEHKADPSIITNLNGLMEKIGETNAHFGLAFDLDGDRGAIVIPSEEIDPITQKKFTVLPPDNLVQVLLPFFNGRGYSVAERGKVAIVRDVLSTKAIYRIAKKIGYESHKTDAGYVYLKAKVRLLKEQGYTVPIYAERSGHAWTHATGAFEDPIVVSLFFAIMGLEYMKGNKEFLYPFLEVFQKNTIPCKQSTRFQPLFGDALLSELSGDSGNNTGWEPGKGKPPTKIISMGKHRVIEKLKDSFKVGAEFDTPAGKLVVSSFDFYFDPEEQINRYADIGFTLDSKDAGSFVFRASSNDPTWVCSFETPIWEGETFSSDSVQKRYDSVGGVVLDYLEKQGFARVAGEGFSYINKSDAEGALCRYRGVSVPQALVRGSHLVRTAPTEAEKLQITFYIKDGEIEQDGKDSTGRIVMFRAVLDRLKHIYGPGLFTKIKKVQIVENLQREDIYPEGRSQSASYKDGVLKIDKLLFDYGTWLLFEEVEHEFLESIGSIIPGSNHAMSDVVATLRNVLRFLDPNMGVTDDKYRCNPSEYQENIIGALKDKEKYPTLDPNGEYLAVLNHLQKHKGKASRKHIIALVVRYALRTKLYEKMRDELGLPDELASEIRDLDINLDNALTVLNQIAEAKLGVLTEKVTETHEVTINVIRTFTGLRVEGISGLSDRLQRMIGVTAKQAYNTDKLAGRVAQQSAAKHILVSKQRLKEFREAISEDEYERVQRHLSENKYIICTEMPKGVNPVNVICTIDPADLQDMQRIEGIFYLPPMPLTRSALYMAANIVDAGGDVTRIDPMVKGFICGLYREILGKEVTDRDLIILFTKPWEYLPQIRSMIADLNILRNAAFKIDKAA